MTVKNETLPKGWREVRLNNVASVKTGPFGTQLHQRDYVQSNGTPIVTVEHLNERGLIHKNLPLVSHHDKQRLSQYLIQEGDIVFSRVGSVDRSALVSRDEDGWLFSGRLLRVRPKKCDVYSSYLNYFFHTRKFRHHMKSIAVGGTMPSINTSILSNVIIHLPSLDQQKAIASLLEKWDTAIEKTEALIEAKEKQFKWLLKTLISDQQDNPEWQKVKLGELFGNQLVIEKGKMLTKAETKKGEFPVVAGGQTYAAFHNEYTHSPKTITISGSGAYAGFIWFHDYPIYATDCNVITAESGFIEYFYYAIKLQQNRLYSLQSGGAQPHIYAKDIAILDIVIPPVKQQKKIAHTLNVTQCEIDLLNQLAEKYRTQKRGLMQKLLTGKWRIQPKNIE